MNPEYREQTKQGEIRAFVEGSDYKSTREALLNLIYSPTANITMGVEFLWGERTNRDESKGTAKQLQMLIRYDF